MNQPFESVAGRKAEWDVAQFRYDHKPNFNLFGLYSSSLVANVLDGLQINYPVACGGVVDLELDNNEIFQSILLDCL